MPRTSEGTINTTNNERETSPLLKDGNSKPRLPTYSESLSDHKTSLRSTILKRNALIAIPCLIILLAAIGGVTYASSKFTSATTTNLGHKGDTIDLGTVNRFWHSTVTASECLKNGDYPHEDRFTVVRTDNLTLHKNVEQYDSVLFNQPRPSVKTGIVSYLYLLKGSSINYRICLAGVSMQQQHGSFFIFDDDQNFWNYQNNPDHGEKLSLFTQLLEIGSNNQSVCTDIRFDIPASGYYFMSSRTPGGIYYSYNTTIQRLYYDITDYPVSCSISSSTCNIPIPGSMFSNDKYVVLGFIVPSEASNPVTTHICVSLNHSDTAGVLITAVGGVVGGLAALVVLVSVVMLIAIFFRTRKSRRGYTVIRYPAGVYKSLDNHP